ncbi:MAG: hypothetical protein J6D28_04065 [Bacilli bacterium]|nr:hypothetical protein [Bacilli bacterium]
MKKNKNYKSRRISIDVRKINLNTYDLNGYHIKPKNKIIYDGVNVNSMTIINVGLIQSLLKKKIKKKLDLYLQFLISVLDEEDTDPGHLMFALNDLDRYRRTVINNYQKYLEKKYVKILMDKMDLLEQELKSKISYEVKDMLNDQMILDLEPKISKSR